jgi:ubiquinone/menaquinone biosynthesis C-methylase UbiE
VDDVFGRIATRYYLLCDLFSSGIHRLWKRRVATLIARESWATYHYLLKGIQDFPSAEALASELSNMGFEEVLFEWLSLGIAAIHFTHKPREQATVVLTRT